MLESVKTTSALFLDLETAASHSSYDEVPEILKKLYEEKFFRFYTDKGETPTAHYEREAGLVGAFGRIVCCSLGRFTGNHKLEIASVADLDEKKILAELHNYLLKIPDTVYLVTHNGTNFDIPFLCQRFLINGFNLPPCLDIAEQKPWERRTADTMLLWRFGDGKSYTKLALLAAILGLPDPKKDLDGSEVSRVFWKEKDLKRISTYCQSDIYTLANIFLRLKDQPFITGADVVYK